VTAGYAGSHNTRKVNMYILSLMLARQLIIAWVTLSLVPIEGVFDHVEAELERNGVNPNL